LLALSKRQAVVCDRDDEECVTFDEGLAADRSSERVPSFDALDVSHLVLEVEL
jgi:hypothetical protein